MIPEFFQSQDPVSHIGFWKSVIGILIVLFASFVGVEIRIEKEDEEP